MTNSTYKPLSAGATPTLGTSGDAVRTLQTQLNTQNQGVAGYTPLKVDGLYGPLTAAAYAKYNTPTGTSTATKSTFVEPTIANSYESDPNYTYAQDIITKKMRGEDIVDTNAIRSDVLAGFQDRINSLNSIYAQKLSEAKQQGVGRVGQTTAILANRGLAGSMRGGAIAEGTLDQNKQIEDAIANEKNLAIQELYGKASEMAVEEAARRRQAIEGGATSYIDFVKNQEITKKDNLGQFASAFIAQGIDPSTMTPDELKGIADKLKVSTNDIISAYKQKQNEEKTQNEYFNLSEGQSRYQLNPNTGQVELLAEKSKSYAPKSSSINNPNDTSSSNNLYKNDLDAILGNTIATIPTKFGQSQFQTQLSRARNDGDKISLIGSVVLKNAPAPVKQDFANQSIAVSNIDKAIAEIDNGAKTGIINSKLQKGFNLVGKDYDPSLSAIASYITSAVQPYRNSVTGAAWGSQEEAEYAQLFGSTAYSPTELKQRLTRLKGIMKDKSAQGLNVYINPLDTYANPFIQNNVDVPNNQTSNMVTVYSIKTGQPAQIPASKVQQALSSGLFRQ